MPMYSTYVCAGQRRRLSILLYHCPAEPGARLVAFILPVFVPIPPTSCSSPITVVIDETWPYTALARMLGIQAWVPDILSK